MTCGQISQLVNVTVARLPYAFNVVVDGLTPDTTYKCCVTALYNNSGESPKMCVDRTTYDTFTSNDSSSVALAISLIVIGLLIVAICPAVTVFVITILVVRRFQLCVKRQRCVLLMCYVRTT